MSHTSSLLHQTIAAFPLPPVDVERSSDQAVIKSVVLPNLAYPLRPSTYIPHRSRVSNVLAIKKTTNFRYDATFMYSTGTAHTVNSSSGTGRHAAYEGEPLKWVKAFFSKNALKAMQKLKNFKDRLRRRWPF